MRKDSQALGRAGADGIHRGATRIVAARSRADDAEAQTRAPRGGDVFAALVGRARDGAGVDQLSGNRAGRGVPVSAIPRGLDGGDDVGEAALREQAVVAREEAGVEGDARAKDVERLAPTLGDGA